MSNSTTRLRKSRGRLLLHSSRRIRNHVLARPSIELLEARWVPNASTLTSSFLGILPNETVDKAYNLGGLNQPATVVGSIGDGPAGAADVTWYEFELTNASRVDLSISTPAENPPFASVLSLFNDDPQDFADPYDLDGYRLLAQVQANPSSGAGSLSQNLAPGDYFVAVSGAGNLDFSPVIADSGYDGETGNYALAIRATDLGLSGDGPTVVASDPTPGAILDSSPLAIRLEMSGPLDPNTLVAGQTIQLFFSPAGATDGSAGNPVAVALASVNFSTAANELQVFPLAPLAPGDYTVSLAGNSGTGQAVLANPDGVPLGEDAAHPAGADESLSFEVDGIDGVARATGSDDTVATAQQLGDLAGAGRIQVNGAIGVDPSFNPSLSPDPMNPEPQYIPANQVDLYHFEISGPGQYAMLAEVFAGRIGSPLNPGISLFELDPSSGALVFLAGNIGTFNPTQGTDGSIPLFTDPALSAGLTAGDYYLAVAGGANTPSPLADQPPGSTGIFDPNQPGSAQNGWSTGPYLLNLLVQAAPNPPVVLASSPSSGQVLDQSPTQITVQFSEPVNVQQLAFQAYDLSAQETLPQVFVEGTDGERYYPRFVSYNRENNQATFQMLDGLANGSYALHLSGPGGLTDFGGNPIVSNDPSGDYVIPFQVQGPDRGISGNMTDGYTVLSQAGDGVPQDFGVLFPDELQAGVTIIRGPQSGASPANPSISDQYEIQLLQQQSYSFTLSGDLPPDGAQVTLTDASGQTIPLNQSSDGLLYLGFLSAGTYTVAVSGWTAGGSASVSYELTINLFGQQNDGPPLVAGPAPLLQIHLESIAVTTQSGTTGETGGGSGPSTENATTGDSGGGRGPATVSLPGTSGLVTAQFAAAGGLTSLGASPLGGASETAATTAAEPVQVALGVPLSPGLGGLVSLVTLTQVLPWSTVGEGLEMPGPVEQPLIEASEGPRSAVPIPTAVTIARPISLGSDSTKIEATTLADSPVAIRPAAQPLSMPNGPGTLVRNIPPRAAATVVSVDKRQLVEWGLVKRVVITGAIVVTAFWGRKAIRDLKWKKRLGAERPRSAGPIWRDPSHGSATVTRPLGAIGNAPPRGSAARSLSGPRSQDAR